MDSSPHLRSGLPGIFSENPELRKAWEEMQAMDPWVIEKQLELTSIPAPPFGEGPRGRRMAKLFQEVGLSRIWIDGVGNVRGEKRPSGPAEAAESLPLILSAHLDTVFPEGTDVTPREEEGRILAPGIADDGRGLAALLALARLLVETPLLLTVPILFVATVGEEGPGDLRGVRHLFTDPGESVRARGFVSLDGVGLDRIIHRGVGSTRLRISVSGPGGHSWTDFGQPNPIHAVGRIVAEAQAISLPDRPQTTLTVARCGGGTSINSIPQDAWMEVDLRSEDGRELLRLEEELRQIWEREVIGAGGGAKVESRSLPQGLSLQVEEIGRRPAGFTDPDEPLVEAAVEATRFLEEEAKLIASSTDANLPMSLGIPSITMGAGGIGGGIHTTDEWYENQKGPEGVLRALLTVFLFSRT